MYGNDRFFQQSVSMNLDSDEQDSGDEEVGTGAFPSTPPSSPPLLLSPSSRPPIRVPSSNSLFGEYIMSSIRRSSASEDDEQTTTPPSYANTPMTLSPPPLIQETPPLFQTGEESVHSNTFSFKGTGRPPLAPHPPFSLVQSRQTSNATSANSNLHFRDKSTGDYSFLSALTDPSDSDGELPARMAEKEPHHRFRHRSVSWDQTWEVNRTQALDILQPILLGDNNPLQQAVPEVLQQVAPPLVVASSHPAPSVRINPLDTINLAEFVSPMESEAETAILRALEDHQREYTPATEMLFPNIPDDAAHSFEEMPASLDDDEPLSIEGTEDEKAEQKRIKYSRGLSRRETASVHSLTTTKPGSVGTKPPLSPSRSKRSEPESKVKPGHHRVNTISTMNEQAGLQSTLFDLTATMREIHSLEQVSLPSANDPTFNRRRLMSQDVRSAGAAFSQEGAIDSQETFVNNANLLFRQHLNRNIESQQQEPLLHRDDTTIPDATPGDDLSPEKQKLFFPANGAPDDNREIDLSAQGLEIDIETGTTEEAVTPVASNETVNSLKADALKHTKQPAQCCIDAVQSVPNNIKRAIVCIQQEYQIFKIFLKPRIKKMKFYARLFALFIFLPTIALSTLLFHGLRNPLVSVGCGDDAKNPCPSISWVLNFLVLRQFISYTLARATEIVLIDFIALKTRAFLRLLGPVATLIFVQSKGWPFQLSCWALYSFALNSGVHRFAEHWLFYQHTFKMLSEENPAGNITNSWWNYRILETALVLGIAAGMKRFLVGLYLGRRMYAIYGNQLAKVIHQMIVVSQVAALGREFEMKMQDPNLAAMPSRKSRKTLGHPLDWDWGGFSNSVQDEDDEPTDEGQQTSKRPQQQRRLSNTTDPQQQRRLSNMTETIKSAASPNIADKRNQGHGMLKGSERIKMMELLEAWEEPEREAGQPGKISISAILQFRQSLAFMDQSFPFALAFGLADSREHCIESSQGVYRRLLLADPIHNKATLEFSTIAVLARADDDNEDSIDPTKMKDLIRIFRPDREGKLSMLDFVKSVDAVYKSLRLLRAAINNSSQIGRATELMINTVFHCISVCGVLAAFKVNPLTFFLSLSSVIIAFAFMIGSASAKYFEGILFILVRKPFDIGDRIAISDPNTDTPLDGSMTWFVEKVDLYTTTARNAVTNEVATIANGSLATSRIINAARSPNAVVHMKLKFGLDVPYTKVQLFRKTVETFVKARPREWLTMIAFWASRVEADRGFIEYVISCQHRERWQDYLPIQESKADLFSYCLEVQKQLGMRYMAPHLPVDLRMAQLDQLGYLGQGPASTGDNQSFPAGERPGEQTGPPRHRVNTSTTTDGVGALADLFMIRRGNGKKL